MARKIEKRQKELLDDLQDHSAGDKAFVIGASYLLDVCSRAVELFDAESTKVEQKRYLIDFILWIIAVSKTGKWYSIVDEVRTAMGSKAKAQNVHLSVANLPILCSIACK